MDIRSLRIGNFVQAGVKETPAIVVLLQENKAIARTSQGVEMEQLFPLLLTEKHLIDFGFEQSKSLDLRIYKKDCIRVEAKDVSYTSGKKAPQFIIKLEDSSQWKKIITGVHELQNYFYDHTGEDLANEADQKSISR